MILRYKTYCNRCIVFGRITSFGGGVGAHGVVSFPDIFWIPLEGAAGCNLIALLKLNFKIFLQILIPENNIVWMFGLVQGETLHIGIDFFGFAIVRENWLSRPQFVLIVKIIISFHFLV